MKIISAEYIKGISGTDDILYDGKFQVAFLGRSNVGKSTLINSLTMRNNLARTSSNPGKTIRMDFFLINNLFHFVDFPGFGFARLSQERRERLTKMIRWYLTSSQVENRLVILITDAKVGITEFDRNILDILREQTINFVIIANKMDKIPTRLRRERISEISKMYEGARVIPNSSKEKYGKIEILKIIDEYLLADNSV